MLSSPRCNYFDANNNFNYTLLSDLNSYFPIRYFRISLVITKSNILEHNYHHNYIYIIKLDVW